MVSLKICVVGAFASGKTSIIKQFVYSIFSDQYISTIGVKLSKKVLTVKGCEATLMLWDIEGKDKFTDINTSYLRGASGFFSVADSSRRETLDDALNVRQGVIDVLGNVPSIMLINKCDLTAQNEFTYEDYGKLQSEGIKYIKTSAKTGEGVEEAFIMLASELLQG